MTSANRVIMRRLIGAAVLMALAFGVSLILPDPSQPPAVEPGVQRVEVNIDDGRIIEPGSSSTRQSPAPATETAQTQPPEMAASSESDAGPEVGDEPGPEPDPASEPEPEEPAPVVATPPVTPPRVLKKPVVPVAPPRPAPIVEAPKPSIPAVTKPPARISEPVPATVTKAPVMLPPPAPASTPTISPAPTPKTPPPSPSAAKSWLIQAGSYADIANARQVETKLKSLGYAVTLSITETGGSARYRVRCGPYPTRELADAARKRLEQNGIPASPVPQGG